MLQLELKTINNDFLKLFLTPHNKQQTPLPSKPLLTYNQYISQYYEHIKFYHQAKNTHSEERSLYDFLHTDDTLSIATDGGVAFEVGSLGIVFSDDQLNRFCHTWGQASGLTMDSFRTKVCAALAATRFLQIYYKHWNSITTDQPMEETDQAQTTNRIIASINIITDSASMIRKLDKMNEYPGAA